MKCPKCHKELESLYAYSLEENVQDVTLSTEEEVDWGMSEAVEGTCEQIEFACSNCREIVYKNKGNSDDPWIKKLLTPEPEITDDSDYDDYLQDEADKIKESLVTGVDNR